MSGYTLLFVFFLLSIGFSFLCSILEAVLLSVTPGFIRKEVEQGSRTGLLLEEYKEDIDRPLSAILTLNTIAHTVGAIGVGAVAGDLFGANYLNIGPLEVSYESIIATVMTLAILIFSEIIPKTIGANNWESLAGFTVKTLRLLLWFLFPLVWVSQLITSRLKKEKDKPVLNRSDILRMSLEGQSSGALQQHESTIIQNLLDFEKRVVRDIMTPRTVVFMLPQKTTVREFIAMEQAMQFSRIPIFSSDKDNVVGIVLKDDILLASSEDRHDETLEDMSRKVESISANVGLPSFYKKMTKSRQHIYLVKDEYAAVIGVVTLEDMIEEMFGLEIMDETDEVKDLQELALKKSESK